MKAPRSGAEGSAARLAVRESPSRGPYSASPPTGRRARGVAERLLATASAAIVSAQGVRAAVPAVASPSPLLQRGVPRGGAALALVASQPDVSRQRSRPSAAARAVSAVPPAVARAAVRAGSRAAGHSGRAAGRAARGPAPSAGFRRILLRPARLLRAVRALRSLSAAEVLRVAVPTGFTARAAA